MTKFNAGDRVVCSDADLCVGGLQKDATYTIDRQSYMGYVWVAGGIAPYMPERFLPVSSTVE